MRVVRRQTLWVIGALLLAVAPVTAQTTTLLAQHVVTTAGADCTTPTNCSVLPEAALTGATSVGVYVDVGTSGTFNFEATLDGSTWVAVTDDINAASSVTSDAARFFSNPGYRSFRVRASAISGAATITYVRGPAGLRSTASLSGGGGDGAIQDGVSAAIEATVFDLTNANPLATQIVDANGDAITSFGGGTQYAVDAALGATPTGTLAVGIRDDALSALTPVEGDAIGLRVDANGALWVIPSGTVTVSGTVTANLSATDNAVLDDIADGIAVTNAGTFATQAAQSGTWTVQPGNTANTTPWLTSISQGGNTAAVNASGQLSITCANCSGSGASSVDDAAFTVASDSGAVAMGLLDDVTPDSVNEGDAGAVRMSANRNLYVQIRDAAGNERGLNVDANGAIAVTGSFSVGLADDADFTAGTTTFSPVGGFYQSSVTACTDGDTCAAGITTGRAIKVALSNADGTLATYQTDATFGTTTYTETSSTGPLVGAVRNDTLATLANTDNEVAPLQVNADGALYVAVSGSVTVTATNLDVQSGGADLATSTQAGAIQTAVELLDNIVGVEDAAETAGGGLAMAGTVRRDTPASSAGTTGDNATLNTSALGAVYTATIDPCSYKAKTFYVVNVATATTTEIANAVASEFFYICSINLVAAGAQTIAIVEDDTDGVGSPTAGLNGGTSAATGWSFAANGGISLGNGNATIMKTSTANRYLGFITGQAAQLSGTIVYVSAP